MLGALCAALLALALTAAFAQADIRIEVSDETNDAAGVYLIEGGANDNHLVIELDDSTVTISAREHLPLVRRFCKRLAGNEVRCRADASELDVYLAQGRDSLRIRGRSKALDVTGSGGGNSDILRGGPGDELLYGDGGADLVIGGDGDDRLRGDELGYGDAPANDVLRGGRGDDDLGDDIEGGHDIFLGGEGDDYIYAIDRGSARRIDGGPGLDRCKRQARDARSVNCEGAQVKALRRTVAPTRFPRP